MMISCKILRPVCSMLLILSILGIHSLPVNAYDIFIGTSGPGTFSYFTGRLLERVINKQSQELNSKAVPGSGDIHNLTNILQGSLDLALIDSRMLHDAANKTGNFKFLDINYQNLSVLVPLYNVPLALIVQKDAGITNLDELKGKRINIGAPLSFQRLSFDTILKAKTWSKNDFSLVAEISTSQSQDTMSFCHGGIDAMIHISVHPDSALQQLFKLCNASIANMNDNDIKGLVDQHPAFFSFKIPSGTYPSQPNDTITFGTQILLIATQDFDEETVHTILSALHKENKRFSSAHPALTLKKPDISIKTYAGIKLHPGTIKYFSGQ